MNEIHLELFAAKKDAVGLSILSSLYHAAEEGSLVHTYLSRADVLFEMRVFAQKPRCFGDVERGLDAILLLNQKITFEFMKKLWVMGSAKVRRRFTKYLELKLHQLFYGPSCYGDGDGVLAFDFCDMQLKKVEDYFCAAVQYHLWRGTSSYLCLFPYQAAKELFRSERCMPYILRLFEAYYSNLIEDDDYFFEVLEVKPRCAELLLRAITTKEQFDLFLQKTDYRYEVCETLLKEKATLFHGDWKNILSLEEESDVEAESEDNQGKENEDEDFLCLPKLPVVRHCLPSSREEEDKSE